MKSCLYIGHIRHQRFTPVKNRFRYGLFLVYLDLSELKEVFRGRWFWSTDHVNLAYFRRRDHLGDPRILLDTAVRDLVLSRTGTRPEGPIRLVTHLRYFGYCFNPVSFYYCYDPSGQHVETIVAEINNTPWGEQHCYVLGETQNRGRDDWKRFEFAKDFHVSPFMDMKLHYDWRLQEPGETLKIHMNNYEGKQKLFDATLTLQRFELTGKNMARVLVQYPFMTAKVVGAIHWQALRLWLKGAPFYSHPGKRTNPSEVRHP